MNAAILMLNKCNGYMSCVKNLGDPDPLNWIAAGCPLPAMMGIERRKGKDKPVITKALVELNGEMFKCYEALRNKWAILDCYQSPGPIQFKGAGSNSINYMVRPPNLDALIYETEVQERFENRHEHEDVVHRQETSLSELSRARIRDKIEIPSCFSKNNYQLSAVKKYTPYTPLVEAKIQEQIKNLHEEVYATHFVEIQDKVMAE